MPHIRPLVICLFLHNGHILVSEERDPIKDETFFRPLGGGIEFGEPGHEIVQVYDGSLVDSGLYKQDMISGHEQDLNLSMKVV